MRCISCNKILTTSESCKKFKISKTFTELCSKCLDTIDVPTIENYYEEPNEDDNLWDERDER